MIIRIVVDLPAPLGPSRPNMPPAGTSSERACTAVWPANRLVMRSRETTMSGIGLGGVTGKGVDGDRAGKRGGRERDGKRDRGGRRTGARDRTPLAG